MNSRIDLHHPEAIYDDLKLKISDLIAKIVKNEHLLDNKLIVGKVNESKQILSFQQKNVEKEMDELKNNAEWDYFTIAFFGETNAGKSTLIEVLRILFAENTKKEVQAKFNQLKKEYSLDETEYEHLKNAEQGFNKNLLEKQSELKDIDQLYTARLDECRSNIDLIKAENEENIATKIVEQSERLEPLKSKIETLKQMVQAKKKSMSWLMKIIYIFKRLEEEKKIGTLNLELKELRSKLDQEIELLKVQIEAEFANKESQLDIIMNEYQEKTNEQDIIIVGLNQQKQVLEGQLKQFENMLEELKIYEDGQIIGDGRSDYTRMSKEFIFDIAGKRVKLIDVPGIEGDETLVENEISKAVKKAHAVFYVTSKDAAPNEGTLKKIKTHLAAQTEVWTIYNKPVTSPRILRGKLIKNEDEESALKDLNDLMTLVLGKNYRNYTVIAGLAAFYSVANCLVPLGEKHRAQTKFLNAFNPDELNEKSGLQTFHNHIVENVIGDVDYKIKSSNFNKANYVILQVVDSLQGVRNQFSKAKKQIDKATIVTKQEIDSNYLDLVQNIKTMIKNIIQQFEIKTRKSVYMKIDGDISNDEFKKILKKEIDINLKKVEKS